MINIKALELVAQHPGVDVGSRITDAHINSKDYNLQKFAIHHKSMTSQEAYDKFDNTNMVWDNGSKWLANKNVSAQHLHQALDKLGTVPSPWKKTIADAVSENPNHDQTHIDRIFDTVKSQSSFKRHLENWNVHPDSFDRMFDKLGFDHKVFLLKNKNTPKEFLEKQSSNPDSLVSMTAKQNLKTRFGE